MHQHEIRKHRNWYFTIACFTLDKLQRAKDDPIGLRWVRFVPFGEKKKGPFQRAFKHASKFARPHETMTSLNLYRANYIRESEKLIKDNKICV